MVPYASKKDLLKTLDAAKPKSNEVPLLVTFVAKSAQYPDIKFNGSSTCGTKASSLKLTLSIRLSSSTLKSAGSVLVISNATNVCMLQNALSKTNSVVVGSVLSTAT